jgi:hypothetical protein
VKQVLLLLLFIVLDDAKRIDPKVMFSEVLHEVNGAVYDAWQSPDVVV